MKDKRHFSGPSADLHEFWHDLRNRATETVREGFLPRLDGRRPAIALMQIVYLPSLSSSTISWHLHRCDIVADRKPSYVGARTEWQMDVDYERCRTPIDLVRHRVNRIEPTIRRCQIDADGGQVEDVWALVSSLSLPIFTEREYVGLDGETYELTLGNYMANMTIRWWCDGPEEWQPLIKPVMVLYETLERQYEEKSDPAMRDDNA